MAESGRLKKNNGKKTRQDHNDGGSPGDEQRQERPEAGALGIVARTPIASEVLTPFSPLVEQIISAFTQGGGYGAYFVAPEGALARSRDYYTDDYLREARLLEQVTAIVRAEKRGRTETHTNPTFGVLDKLVARGLVTNKAVIADAIESNARLLMSGGEQRAAGLEEPRFDIVRVAGNAPLLLPPHVQTRDLIAMPRLVIGEYEWTWIYLRREPSEPFGVTLAFRVSLRDAVAITGWTSSSIYARTSSRRRDWALDRARIRTDDSSREIAFHPQGFWHWWSGRHRK